MKIEFNMFEVLDSLKKTGHIPENFTLDELSVSFNKWEGRKKKAKWETEVLSECSDLTLFGYTDCDCDDD